LSEIIVYSEFMEQIEKDFEDELLTQKATKGKSWR
jgi:hypothetical protein